MGKSRRGRSSIPITRSRRRARPTHGVVEGKPTGPLHGVPVGVKDIFDTADMPTENGSVLLRRPHAVARCHGGRDAARRPGR